jgi:hypothetical protein
VTQALVTFVFPAFGGNKTGQVDLPWEEGMMLKQYLHHPVLRPFHLRAKVETHKFYNAKRECVRQYYSPTPGDAIVLVPVG